MDVSLSILLCGWHEACKQEWPCIWLLNIPNQNLDISVLEVLLQAGRHKACPRPFKVGTLELVVVRGLYYCHQARSSPGQSISQLYRPC